MNGKADAMEDATMIHAIQEGEESEPASRAEVFDILEGKVSEAVD